MPTEDSRDVRLEEVLFYQIEQAMRQSIRYTHRVFAEAGVDLTKDQWLVLKKINDDASGLAPLEIARVLGKEAASMTRMLDILERKGLLIRQPNPADRRSSLITPTAQGTELYHEVLPLVAGIRKQAIRGLAPDELRQLRRSLNLVRDNLA
ncbi:MAG: MarR family transcriptional regulator [Bacteroidota bacterium]